MALLKYEQKRPSLYNKLTGGVSFRIDDKPVTQLRLNAYVSGLEKSSANEERRRFLLSMLDTEEQLDVQLLKLRREVNSCASLQRSVRGSLVGDAVYHYVDITDLDTLRAAFDKRRDRIFKGRDLVGVCDLADLQKIERLYAIEYNCLRNIRKFVHLDDSSHGRVVTGDHIGVLLDVELLLSVFDAEKLPPPSASCLIS